jgi:uncharacterized protein
MFKLLLLIIGIWLILSMLNRARRRDVPPGTPRDQGEAMVRCAECGVYVPRSASVLSAGHYYCCAEHAARHTTQ